MKIKKVLLRWYKSFHLNYRGYTEKGESTAFRPWNKISPKFAPTEEFPFLEIPVEDDITTIVGANESGKSHLLNAISKVMRQFGTDAKDEFRRTDLCQYAGVRTRNVEAWPNIGLVFSFSADDEYAQLNKALGGTLPTAPPIPKSFALVLAPEEDESKPAYVFIEPNDQPARLDKKQLAEVRKILPSVQFIDSHALLASEIPMAYLIAACGDAAFNNIAFLNRKAVEEAAKEIRKLPALSEVQPAGKNVIHQIEEIKKRVEELAAKVPGQNTLEMHLFKEILDISLDTQRYIYGLATEDRTYIEGQIAKWNEEINNKLNLSHFWRQDEKFALRVNLKDGVVYFEITDKTESIYNFRDRSSGLKYFLSYYIQAKAMELSHRNRNSVILMDEPDSALSVLGQRNLLAVFESLVSPESSNQTCQLIYTTHSPYLINRNFPRRIRVVKKEDAEEGTQYIEQARARRYEPVRTALGIDNAPSLFLGLDNILLEGATDQFLLTELIRVFATPLNVGEFLDLNSVVVVSADGVGNIPNVLEQSRWADEPIPPTVVLVDSDKSGQDVQTRITENTHEGKMLVSKEFVKSLAEIVKPFGDNIQIISIEDIVPIAIYREATANYFKRWLPDTVKQYAAKIEEILKDANFGKEGLVAGTKALFRAVKPEFEKDYDKMGIFQEVVAITTAKSGDATNSDAQNIKKNTVLLCDFIREGLSRSRAVTARQSVTQAIKRIVSDFNRLNKDNVPVTSLQRLFRRLESEVAPIGADGEGCLRVITNSLADLERLRGAGQDRVVKDVWAKWKTLIDRIKHNPLTAEMPSAANDGH